MLARTRSLSPSSPLSLPPSLSYADQGVQVKKKSKKSEPGGGGGSKAEQDRANKGTDVDQEISEANALRISLGIFCFPLAFSLSLWAWQASHCIGIAGVRWRFFWPALCVSSAGVTCMLLACQLLDHLLSSPCYPHMHTRACMYTRTFTHAHTNTQTHVQASSRSRTWISGRRASSSEGGQEEIY